MINLIINLAAYLVAFVVIFYIVAMIWAFISGGKETYQKTKYRNELANDVINETQLTSNNWLEITCNHSNKNITGYYIKKLDETYCEYNFKQHGYNSSQPDSFGTGYSESKRLLKLLQTRIGGKIVETFEYREPTGGFFPHTSANGDISFYDSTEGGHFKSGYKLISKKGIEKDKFEKSKNKSKFKDI